MMKTFRRNHNIHQIRLTLSYTDKKLNLQKDLFTKRERLIALMSQFIFLSKSTNLLFNLQEFT